MRLLSGNCVLSTSCSEIWDLQRDTEAIERHADYMPALRRYRSSHQVAAAHALVVRLDSVGIYRRHDWRAFLRAWTENKVSLWQMRCFVLFAHDGFTGVFCFVPDHLFHRRRRDCIWIFAGIHVETNAVSF